MAPPKSKTADSKTQMVGRKFATAITKTKDLITGMPDIPPEPLTQHELIGITTKTDDSGLGDVSNHGQRIVRRLLVSGNCVVDALIIGDHGNCGVSMWFS